VRGCVLSVVVSVSESFPEYFRDTEVFILGYNMLAVKENEVVIGNRVYNRDKLQIAILVFERIFLIFCMCL
jgi:hypothetical protein